MATVVGYLASVLLVISLLLNNDLKFRLINACGGVCFVIYGIMIDATPIIITNATVLSINIFYLIRIFNTQEDFDIIYFNAGDRLIKKFLNYYKTDIANYFPDYDPNAEGNQVNFLVLRNMAVANVFSANLDESGTAEVKINYTVPKYRDFKVGKFIFDREKKHLLKKGVKQVCYREVKNKNHEDFLKTMGFEKTPGTKSYSKILA